MYSIRFFIFVKCFVLWVVANHKALKQAVQGEGLKRGKGDKRRGNQKVERWLLMFALRQVISGREAGYMGSEFQSKAVRGKKLDEYRQVFALGTDTV